MRKIAFPVGYYCDIRSFIENPSNQLFSYFVLNQTYPSYIFYQVKHQIGDFNLVSALHCQSGHKTRTSILIHSVPSTIDNPETLIMDENKLIKQDEEEQEEKVQEGGRSIKKQSKHLKKNKKT